MSMYEDFYTLLVRAGLPEEEAKRIAGDAAADAQSKRAEERSEGNRVVEDEDDIQMQHEQGLEKLIKLIARRTGIELWSNYPINFEGDVVTVTLNEGEVNLQDIIRFAEELEANEVGSNCSIGANHANNVVLTFKVA